MGYNSKYKSSEIEEILDSVEGKQDKLTSGTNIKTINGQSLVGSGDIEVSGGVSEEYVTTAIANAITATLNTAV